MTKTKLAVALIVALIAGIAVLKLSPWAAPLVWSVSGEGAWLLPLVLVASVLDSVHPCSFSILLITIAVLLSLRFARGRIIGIGATYVAGIFAAYLLIGLGIFQALHLFDTPHFMGKLGAGILVAFGAINLLNYLFPAFPIKLKMPSVAHGAMGRLMEKASYPTAFGLGALVGLCQFPCMGGPYLMVIGLLRDQATYFAGFGYLVLYNLVLIVPLLAVLWIAANRTVLSKLEEWKRVNLGKTKLYAGIAMIALGLLILFI